MLKLTPDSLWQKNSTSGAFCESVSGAAKKLEVEGENHVVAGNARFMRHAMKDELL